MSSSELPTSHSHEGQTLLHKACSQGDRLFPTSWGAGGGSFPSPKPSGGEPPQIWGAWREASTSFPNQVPEPQSLPAGPLCAARRGGRMMTVLGSALWEWRDRSNVTCSPPSATSETSAVPAPCPLRLVPTKTPPLPPNSYTSFYPVSSWDNSSKWRERKWRALS